MTTNQQKTAGVWSCWASSVIALLAVWSVTKTGSTQFKPLSCYRCMSLSCNTSPEICALAKAYMQQEIQNHYYTDGYPLPDCPDPANEPEWVELETKLPSNLPCGEFASGQATCVLGRFQINSLVIESNTNFTSYGTVLGCAKKRLLDAVKVTTLGKDRKVIETFHSSVGCHYDNNESHIQDSLKHYSRLEHCAKLSDYCYTSSFCIHPRSSEVRGFTTSQYNELNENSVGLMTIFFCVAGVIGFIIAVMTFLGIKYS